MGYLLTILSFTHNRYLFQFNCLEYKAVDLSRDSIEKKKITNPYTTGFFLESLKKNPRTTNLTDSGKFPCYSLTKNDKHRWLNMFANHMKQVDYKKE